MVLTRSIASHLRAPGPVRRRSSGQALVIKRAPTGSQTRASQRRSRSCGSATSVGRGLAQWRPDGDRRTPNEFALAITLRSAARATKARLAIPVGTPYIMRMHASAPRGARLIALYDGN